VVPTVGKAADLLPPLMRNDSALGAVMLGSLAG
jgi:hypothetical protein